MVGAALAFMFATGFLGGGIIQAIRHRDTTPVQRERRHQ